jgi:hypothetical protein
MKHVVTITASGKVGSGKSAVLGEIEIAMKALGVPVRYLDEASAQSEKNMTHADWQSALDMYQPEVVLVETCTMDHAEEIARLWARQQERDWDKMNPDDRGQLLMWARGTVRNVEGMFRNTPK